MFKCRTLAQYSRSEHGVVARDLGEVEGAVRRPHHHDRAQVSATGRGLSVVEVEQFLHDTVLVHGRLGPDRPRLIPISVSNDMEGCLKYGVWIADTSDTTY